jgi:hypothetical protein
LRWRENGRYWTNMVNPPSVGCDGCWRAMGLRVTTCGMGQSGPLGRKAQRFGGPVLEREVVIGI